MIPDLIARRAELRPDAIALEQDGRLFTYAELNHRAAQAATLLASHGVGEGDRVALFARNRTEFFELLFACAKLGAILVPLNWRMPLPELAPLFADAEPALIVTGAEDQAIADQLADGRPVLNLDDDYDGRLADPHPGRAHWPEDGIWYLIYTSGTTGAPKGVIYTYRMALANYVNIRSAVDIGSADTTANFLPLFHTAGINLHSLPTLFAGGRVIVVPGHDAEALVRLIEARRLDAFFAVPAVYQSLLDHPRSQAAPLGHVRHWGCGGAPLPDALIERYRALGVRVCNGMGMTETGPTAFLLDPADAWDRIGSVGKPQLLCSVRIIDGEGRDVPDGVEGDLLFAGPGVTPGYWRNEAATREAFTPDGWLRSGDIARRDADGFTYVVGRRKDMFISGGENVFPAEIENVLCAHPAITEAAVIGVPDERWGEVGRAFLQPIPGVAALDFEEVEAFCRARLAAYKIPRRFEIVADFPRTAAGKIRKHELIEEPVRLRLIGGG
jgi:fatty-acyl-CoA synthase